MATTTTNPITEIHELQTIHSGNAQVLSSPPNESNNSGRTVSEPTAPRTSKARMVTTILQLAGVNLLASSTNGVMTVGLPTIARDINLPRELYLWPLSVLGLTCGSILLLAGSVTDVTGSRRAEILGSFMIGAFTLACGLAETGIQLTLFRAFQGVAMAIHLPAAISIATSTVPKGKGRNMAFASMGFARDIGYSIGLVLGGVLIEASGWRLNFYLAGGASLLIAMISIWSLPKERRTPTDERILLKELYDKIDWLGGFMISGGLALLAYVLAVISADLDAMTSASTAALFATSLVLLIAFPCWMSFRERRGKPALIPNSLWNNASFASTCAILALSNGCVIALELFSSLYFQEIQNARTLTTSLQLLPNVVVGVLVGLGCGFFVHRVPARWLVTGACIVCGCAPLLMAIADPDWTYWYVAFWAQALSPISVSVLVTVGMLIVSDVFPDGSQALAGAVFNTVGQFGLSFGVGICQLVALGVSGNEAQAEHGGSHQSQDVSHMTDDATLLSGYRASFWTMLGYMALCSLLAFSGLRRVGKVGLKRD